MAQVNEETLVLGIFDELTDSQCQVFRDIDVAVELLVQSVSQAVGVVDFKSLPVRPKMLFMLHFFDVASTGGHDMVFMSLALIKT